MDYAYSPFGDLGTSHQVSLSYRFETAAPTPVPTRMPAPKMTVLPALPSLTPIRTSPVTVMVIPTPQAIPTATPVPVGSKSDAEKLKLFFSLPENQATPVATPNSPLEQKIQSFKDAIAQNPQDEKAWYQLGSLYYQQGRKEDAVQCFEQVLRLKPDNQKLRDWLMKYKNP